MGRCMTGCGEAVRADGHEWIYAIRCDHEADGKSNDFSLQRFVHAAAQDDEYSTRQRLAECKTARIEGTAGNAVARKSSIL